MAKPCNCPAYKFPHREGSGKCRADEGPVCSECGGPCEGRLIDFGIGPGEAWGVRFNDVRKEWTSECCEADMLGFIEPEPGEERDDVLTRSFVGA